MGRRIMDNVIRQYDNAKRKVIRKTLSRGLERV